MHPEAYEFVRSCVAQFAPPPERVLDIGGRNINGSIRDLFPQADFRALDIAPGDGVDIVADAAFWQPTETFNCVTCCEVFEHTPRWKRILGTMKRACPYGGAVIVTAAAEPRLPHSAIDGRLLEPDEYSSDACLCGIRNADEPTIEFYCNVDPDELRHEMEMRFRWVRVQTHPHGDVYGVAVV